MTGGSFDGWLLDSCRLGCGPRLSEEPPGSRSAQVSRRRASRTSAVSSDQASESGGGSDGVRIARAAKPSSPALRWKTGAARLGCLDYMYKSAWRRSVTVMPEVERDLSRDRRPSRSMCLLGSEGLGRECGRVAGAPLGSVSGVVTSGRGSLRPWLCESRQLVDSE